MGGLFGGPSTPPPPPPPEPDPVEPDEDMLARQRAAMEARRRNRDDFRIDPQTGLSSSSSGTGLTGIV